MRDGGGGVCVVCLCVNFLWVCCGGLVDRCEFIMGEGWWLIWVVDNLLWGGVVAYLGG